MTTTANREARGGQGALSKVNLPQLILDAMLLVSQIGERYLWVDCLCIEQDNPSQKHSQVSQMDVIYSQSLLTLVALSSDDVRAFLPGIREGTRSLFRAKDYAFDRDLYALYPRLLELSEASVYESRGWTFQERLLSRRCLFFTDYDMYYTCHSSISCQTQVNSTAVERQSFRDRFRNIFTRVDKDQELRPSWTTKFSLYASLVHDYSKRELTYDTDVMNAFSGINAVLGYSLQSSSVGGLIDSVLDACLLWVPGESNTHCRNLNFPSWSWAGWKGEASYLSGPLYHFTKSCDTFQFLVRSLVEKFDTQSMSPIRPILRLEQDQEGSTIPDQEPATTIKTIDILYFEASAADFMQLDIATDTARGNVCIAPFETQTRKVRVITLFDAAGRTCGYLHNFLPPVGRLDLVALSRSQYPLGVGMVPYDSPSETDKDKYSVLFDHEAYQAGDWCLLNIMLIKWQESAGEPPGVAERVTIGQIHIDAWNKLETARKQIWLA